MTAKFLWIKNNHNQGSLDTNSCYFYNISSFSTNLKSGKFQ